MSEPDTSLSPDRRLNFTAGGPSPKYGKLANFISMDEDDHSARDNRKRSHRSMEDHRESRKGLEKNRRDRLNGSLALLSQLVPNDYFKKGQTLSKTAILDVAVDYIQHLQATQGHEVVEPLEKVEKVETSKQRDSFTLGFQRCSEEVMGFLCNAIDPGVFERLQNYLQSCSDILERSPVDPAPPSPPSHSSPPSPPNERVIKIEPESDDRCSSPEHRPTYATTQTQQQNTYDDARTDESSRPVSADGGYESHGSPTPSGGSRNSNMDIQKHPQLHNFDENKPMSDSMSNSIGNITKHIANLEKENEDLRKLYAMEDFYRKSSVTISTQTSTTTDERTIIDQQHTIVTQGQTIEDQRHTITRKRSQTVPGFALHRTQKFFVPVMLSEGYLEKHENVQDDTMSYPITISVIAM